MKTRLFGNGDAAGVADAMKASNYQRASTGVSSIGTTVGAALTAIPVVGWVLGPAVAILSDIAGGMLSWLSSKEAQIAKSESQAYQQGYSDLKTAWNLGNITYGQLVRAQYPNVGDWSGYYCIPVANIPDQYKSQFPAGHGAGEHIDPVVHAYAEGYSQAVNDAYASIVSSGFDPFPKIYMMITGPGNVLISKINWTYPITISDMSTPEIADTLRAMMAHDQPWANASLFSFCIDLLSDLWGITPEEDMKEELAQGNITQEQIDSYEKTISVVGLNSNPLIEEPEAPTSAASSAVLSNPFNNKSSSGSSPFSNGNTNNIDNSAAESDNTSIWLIVGAVSLGVYYLFNKKGKA